MYDPDQIESYDFDLPETLIADVPAEHRDASRLLMASTGSRDFRFGMFPDLLDQLHPGDLVVFNDSRVVPARVFVNKPSGGRVELLLLDVLGEETADRWVTARGVVRVRAMYRASKGLSPGGILRTPDGVQLEVVEAEQGFATLEVFAPEGMQSWLEARGELPLPPYIVKRREVMGRRFEADSDRYQTVYAGRPGSVAAPTAGLHFTQPLLRAMAERGIQMAHVTLEVGPGTFRPVKTERLSEHDIHSERYHVPEGLADQISAARRVVAVGTTTVRVLESEARRPAPFEAGTRESTLFLKPGDSFGVVDAMVTNFHLPKSTLLALVSAFAGLDFVRELYAAAIEKHMRFYSYGDAMFLTREELR